MGLIYGEKKNLTLDKIIDTTKHYLIKSIDRFTEEDLERSRHLKEFKTLSNFEQQKFIDYTNKIDKTLIFTELKVSTVLSLGNVLLLNQSNAKRLNQSQLIYLSCYLTEKSLDSYPRTTKILGNRKILDPMFKLTTNYFEQRSIFRYIDEMSEIGVKDIEEKETLSQFQEGIANFLTTNTLGRVLEKTNYQKDLASVQESLKQIL